MKDFIGFALFIGLLLLSSVLPITAGILFVILCDAGVIDWNP